MVGIAAHAKAQHLGIDFRAAGPGHFILLQHEDTGAIAQHETVPVPVPGPGGCLGVIIARGQCPGCSKSTQAHRGGGHLGTAHQHRIGVTQRNQLGAKPDVVCARGTGSDDGEIGALHIEHHRQVARDHVDDGAGDKKWRYLAWPRGLYEVCVFLDLAYATNAGADSTTHPRCEFLGDFQSAVLHGLDTCRHAKLDEEVHFARVLDRQVQRDIEVLDACAEAGAVGRHVKALDGCDTALACQNSLPGVLHGMSERTEHAHACNNDSSANQHADSFLARRRRFKQLLNLMRREA